MPSIKQLLAWLLVSVAATHASAAWVSADLDTPGDGLLVQDTASGLTWLNLSVTRGQSFDQVLASGLLQTFRVATDPEVRTLLANSSTEFQGQAVFTRLGALTLSPEENINLGGDGGDSWLLAGAVASGEGAGAVNQVNVLSILETIPVPGNTARYLRLKLTVQDSAAALPDVGVFLVSVPEPSTYALMGMGLLMLVWQVRRTRTRLD